MDKEERLRVAALEEYASVDSTPEPRFEAIARVVSRVFGTPMAFISLVDASRHWPKRGGVLRGVARDVTFCARGIQSDEVFVVENAEQDPDFADNPLVTAEGGLRFYAGAPLVVPGRHRLGMLCAVDVVPHEVDERQLALLTALSRRVVELFELHRRTHRLGKAFEEARALIELIPICASCEMVRDDADGWSSLAKYLEEHLGVRFAAERCPACTSELGALDGPPSGALKLPSALDAAGEDSLEYDEVGVAEATISELVEDPAERAELLGALSSHDEVLAALRSTSTRLAHVIRRLGSIREQVSLCVSCHAVARDDGCWSHLRDLVRDELGVEFTHGICPKCIEELYPEVAAAMRAEHKAD